MDLKKRCSICTTSLTTDNAYERPKKYLSKKKGLVLYIYYSECKKCHKIAVTNNKLMKQIRMEKFHKMIAETPLHVKEKIKSEMDKIEKQYELIKFLTPKTGERVGLIYATRRQLETFIKILSSEAKRNVKQDFIYLTSSADFRGRALDKCVVLSHPYDASFIMGNENDFHKELKSLPEEKVFHIDLSQLIQEHL